VETARTMMEFFCSGCSDGDGGRGGAAASSARRASGERLRLYGCVVIGFYRVGDLRGRGSGTERTGRRLWGKGETGGAGRRCRCGLDFMKRPIAGKAGREVSGGNLPKKLDVPLTPAVRRWRRRRIGEGDTSGDGAEEGGAGMVGRCTSPSFLAVVGRGGRGRSEGGSRFKVRGVGLCASQRVALWDGYGEEGNADARRGVVAASARTKREFWKA